MCGICGYAVLGPAGELPRPDAETVVRRMVGALAHRGPDDRGGEPLDGRRVVLGHTRLSILDLTPAGRQPMRDPVSDDRVVFNGEIYNFRALRRDLERRGHTFASRGDTEVLLRSYAAEGLDAVARWRGMFACVIWDASARTLHLVRDRLGIKPLYYYRDGARLLFASEVRALLASGRVPLRLNREALATYLAFGSVQEPLTLVAGVYALQPGHTLTLATGDLCEREYWDAALAAGGGDGAVSSLATGAAGTKTEAGTEAALLEVLRDAVGAHLVSDAPLGAFLSGGIDSGVVAALAREMLPRRAHTFCVGFASGALDESEAAARAARRLGTDHRAIPVTRDEALATLPGFLAALDQPSFDGLNTYIVARAARQAGVKVALSGLGGDELFGGYPLFHQIPLLRRAQHAWSFAPPPVQGAAGAVLRRTGRSDRHDRLAALFDLSSEPIEARGARGARGPAHPYEVMRALLTPRRWEALLDGPVSPLDDDRYAAATRRRDAPPRRAAATRRRDAPPLRAGAGSGPLQRRLLSRTDGLHVEYAAARRRRDEHGSRPRTARAAGRPPRRRARLAAARSPKSAGTTAQSAVGSRRGRAAVAGGATRG